MYYFLNASQYIFSNKIYLPNVEPEYSISFSVSYKVITKTNIEIDRSLISYSCIQILEGKITTHFLYNITTKVYRILYT